MKLKKICIFLLTMAFLLYFGNIICEASTDEIQNGLNEKYGVNQLDDQLTDDARDMLEQWKFDLNNPTDFSPENIFGSILDIFKNKASTPFKTFFIIIGIVVLSGLFKMIDSDAVSEKTLNYISIVIIVSVAIVPLAGLIEAVSNVLTVTSGFIMALIPVYATVLISSGRLSSGSTASGFVFIASQVVAFFTAKIFVPLSSGFIAVSCAVSLSDNPVYVKWISSIKKIITIILGFTVCIYSAVLTVTGSVNSSIDSIGRKTLQFFSSTGVPIVGGALSEAVGVIANSMDIVKSSVGIYGILGILALTLPCLISLVVWRLSFGIISAIADAFSLEGVSACFSVLGQGLGIMISLAVTICTVFIVSLSVIK